MDDQLINRYRDIVWIETTCQHCGGTITTLATRPPKFCHCCGIAHANQYRHRPSIVTAAFREGAARHD